MSVNDCKSICLLIRLVYGVCEKILCGYNIFYISKRNLYIEIERDHIHSAASMLHKNNTKIAYLLHTHLHHVYTNTKHKQNFAAITTKRNEMGKKHGEKKSNYKLFIVLMFGCCIL